MTETQKENHCVGEMSGGGLRSNIQVTLRVPPSQTHVGDYLILADHPHTYFGAVVDITYPKNIHLLRPTGQDLDDGDVWRAANQLLYRPTAEVMITLVSDNSQNDEVLPATTIPQLGVLAYLADEASFQKMFGVTKADNPFVVGYTLGQHFPVPLILNDLCRRSFGVFGVSGSGKSFLVRLLLAGLISQRAATLLIFDFHDEFAFPDVDEQRRTVPGLKTSFPDDVVVFGIGDDTEIRGYKPDHVLRIGYGDVWISDVLMVREMLGLADGAPHVLGKLVSLFKSGWLAKALAMPTKKSSSHVGEIETIEAWAAANQVAQASATALREKLEQLRSRPYLVPTANGSTLHTLLDCLWRGKSVVLAFGNHDSELDLILISNILGRVMAKRWEDASKVYRTTGANPPRQAVIVLEEAHKILSPTLARQSIFAQLVKELRKSFLTVMLIDQRPSRIYEEVLSQLVTKFVCWLADDDDIAAVLAGLSNKDNLRRMLTSMNPNQQALIAGQAIATPMLMRTRTFDQAFITRLLEDKL